MAETSRGRALLGAGAVLLAVLSFTHPGCRQDRLSPEEREVLATLPDGQITVLDLGPHDYGDDRATLRVRYRVNETGEERDMLYNLSGGELRNWHPNPHGDAWREHPCPYR